ncbi:hypothetical protein [Streptomyces sp. NPDC050560]|uniref:hypothetical protein n=1 Tax=Streptomyces sp. NPDC050560 TaxID=3365630 RepID=UPI003796DBC2
MRHRVTTLALLAVTAFLAAFLPPSAAQAAGLPLGKADFAIAVGDLRADSTHNWVRLGEYTFTPSGQVTERHWHWSNDTRVKRASTGFLASGCTTRDCTVLTAGGYQSTGASSTLSGTYTVTGDKLRVTWSGGDREEWTLTSKADGALAEVEFSASNYHVTHGFGAGSNAAWDARVPVGSLASLDWSAYIHRYYLWKTSEASSTPYIDHADGNPFWLRDWKTCDSGQCIGGETSPGRPGATEYYISPARAPVGHRRDTLWGWRQANAAGKKCYTGNSHVKPMLQVIDENGQFHGWVGVEGSISQTVPQQGVFADDIGVFRIED